MKNKFVKLTSLIFLGSVLEFNSTILAQNQVDPMTEVEKDNCDRTVEVNYRSRKLTSLDGNTTVYFEGILRRVGKKGDKVDGQYCSPLRGRQTPVTTMIIENQGNVKRISLPVFTDGYSVLNLVFFLLMIQPYVFYHLIRAWLDIFKIPKFHRCFLQLIEEINHFLGLSTLCFSSFSPFRFLTS